MSRNDPGRRPVFAKIFLAPAAAALIAAAAVPAEAASPVEDFYKGKNLVMMIGYAAGASYDGYARLAARHMGQYIPGKPNIVPQNKPGSGSLVATNYIYNVAPKDGTVMGVVGQSVYLMQLLEQPGIKFDAAKFNWIGRLADVNSLVVSWNRSGARTHRDLKSTTVPIAVGGTLSGSTMFIAFMNKLNGYQFRPIKGYGSAAAVLAMERGEVDGTASITAMQLKAERMDWIKNKTVNVLVQVALEKDPMFKDVPLLTDLAPNPDVRRMYQALSSTNGIGRAIMAPPDIPADRVAALRAAFDAMAKDKKFLGEAERMRFDISPLSGTELQKVVLAGGDLTPDMIKTMKEIVAMPLPDRKKTKKKKATTE